MSAAALVLLCCCYFCLEKLSYFCEFSNSYETLCGLSSFLCVFLVGLAVCLSTLDGRLFFWWFSIFFFFWKLGIHMMLLRFWRAAAIDFVCPCVYVCRGISFRTKYAATNVCCCCCSWLVVKRSIISIVLLAQLTALPLMGIVFVYWPVELGERERRIIICAAICERLLSFHRHHPQSHKVWIFFWFEFFRGTLPAPCFRGCSQFQLPAALLIAVVCCFCCSDCCCKWVNYF